MLTMRNLCTVVLRRPPPTHPHRIAGGVRLPPTAPTTPTQLHTTSAPSAAAAAGGQSAANSPSSSPAAALSSSSPHSSSSGLQQHRRLFRESYFKRRDHIADEYALVYRAAPMEFTIAGCKHLASSSLLTSAGVVAYKLATNQAIVDTANLQVAFGPLQSEADELLWFGAAFVGFNVAMLCACNRFPLRIYRRENSYVAMFEGWLPMSARPYAFDAGELRETFDGFLPWKDAMYSMRRRSVLLLTQYFKTPSELNAMLSDSDSDERAAQRATVAKKYK